MSQIETLRKEFSKINTIDPSLPAYNKLCDFLDSSTTKELQEFVDADIKWVSSLARNRVNLRKYQENK